MKAASAFSTELKADQAFRDCLERVLASLGGSASYLFFSASSGYDRQELTLELSRLNPGLPLHGSSSCQGVMTQYGFHSKDGRGMGLFALRDEKGAYGVGIAEIENSATTAAARAIEQALRNARRAGEMPELIFISGAPGQEEYYLQGVEEVVGKHVPIIGGSSADNEVAGQWSQFAQGRASRSAVVVSAFFPSTELAYSFHSGYIPTPITGNVTRASNRILYEIDGQPAAIIYNEWTNNSIASRMGSDASILALTTLAPLGRIVELEGRMPSYRMLHPDGVRSDNALTLFSNVQEGEQLTLMKGTPESLVQRAGEVAQSALDMNSLSVSEIAGALVTYCAGCMLTVRDKMPEVASGLSRALEGAPYLGNFTFGEQGCFSDFTNRHANLMISALVFTNRMR